MHAAIGDEADAEGMLQNDEGEGGEEGGEVGWAGGRAGEDEGPDDGSLVSSIGEADADDDASVLSLSLSLERAPPLDSAPPPALSPLACLAAALPSLALTDPKDDAEGEGQSSYGPNSPRALFLSRLIERDLPPSAVALLRMAATPRLSLAHMAVSNELVVMMAECLHDLPLLSDLRWGRCLRCLSFVVFVVFSLCVVFCMLLVACPFPTHSNTPIAHSSHPFNVPYILCTCPPPAVSRATP